MRDSKTRNLYVLDEIISDDHEQEINDYYEGFLNQYDAQYIGGFDWNTEMCVSEFFDNFSQYLPDLAKVLPEHVLTEIKDAMLDKMEAERDQLITSMIDVMSDVELSKTKMEYETGNYNYVLQQNSGVFGFAREDGTYDSDVSAYVDAIDINMSAFLDIDTVVEDNEYCPECVCKDTCSRLMCIYKG